MICCCDRCNSSTFVLQLQPTLLTAALPMPALLLNILHQTVRCSAGCQCLCLGKSSSHAQFQTYSIYTHSERFLDLCSCCTFLLFCSYRQRQASCCCTRSKQGSSTPTNPVQSTDAGKPRPPPPSPPFPFPLPCPSPSLTFNNRNQPCLKTLACYLIGVDFCRDGGMQHVPWLFV